MNKVSRHDGAMLGLGILACSTHIRVYDSFMAILISLWNFIKKLFWAIWNFIFKKKEMRHICYIYIQKYKIL